MNCPKCNAPGLLVEASPDGKTQTLKCQKCGFTEVKDTQGRKLLTEVVPHTGSPICG
jgi:transposase-like protein